MADFSYPPLDPTPDPAPLSPTVPLNPPMVGEASPFDPVRGQNRDIILEAIRAWARTSLRDWTGTWQTKLTGWLDATTTWLNGFNTAAVDYIGANAIPGLSWWRTDTVIAPTGSTTVVIVPIAPRTIQVGEFVTSPASSRYGVITSVVDETHAVVQYLGPVQTYGTSVNPIDAGYDPLTPRPPGLTGPAFWTAYVEPVYMGNDDVLLNLLAQQWSPRTLVGLHAWYDPRQMIGYADGAPITVYQDKSGNSRHLLLSNGVGAPTFSAAGIPGGAVAFDGSTLLRTDAFVDLPTAVTVLFNAKITNNSTTGYAVAGSTATSGSDFGIGQNVTTRTARRSNTVALSATGSFSATQIYSQIIVFELDGSVRHYVDGTLVTYTGTTGTAAANPLRRWQLGGRYAGSTLSNAAAAGTLIGDVVYAASSLPASDVAAATAWLLTRRTA